jgi:hypothetical protein
MSSVTQALFSTTNSLVLLISTMFRLVDSGPVVLLPIPGHVAGQFTPAVQDEQEVSVPAVQLEQLVPPTTVEPAAATEPAIRKAPATNIEVNAFLICINTPLFISFIGKKPTRNFLPHFAFRSKYI